VIKIKRTWTPEYHGKRGEEDIDDWFNILEARAAADAWDNEEYLQAVMRKLRGLAQNTCLKTSPRHETIGAD